MRLVEQLMEAAAADTEVLRSLDAQGDRFGTPRDVDFLIDAPSREVAETIAGFVNDHHYGRAIASEADGNHSVLVVVHMPVHQPVILSVSGFMVCIARLFGGEYDGWGCVVPTPDRTQ